MPTGLTTGTDHRTDHRYGYSLTTRRSLVAELRPKVSEEFRWAYGGVLPACPVQQIEAAIPHCRSSPVEYTIGQISVSLNSVA